MSLASSTSSLSAQVASNNADIILAIAQETSRRAGVFQTALTTFLADPSQDNLTAANKALESTYLAFLESESAVFFTNPSVDAEMNALPDPANVTETAGSPNDFNSLENLLTSYSTEISTAGPNVDSLKNSLVEQSARLTKSMQTFANAWTTDDGSNFRNEFFLQSNDDAISRILQGASTIVGTVLPQGIQGVDLSGHETGYPLSSDEAVSALLGLESLFSGTYQTSNGGLISGNGLQAIISAANPDAAQSIENSLLDAVTAAQKLDPEDPESQQALLKILSTLNTEISSAASNSGVLLSNASP